MENIIQSGDCWRVRLIPDELEYDDSYLELARLCLASRREALPPNQCQDLLPQELETARRELWATIERNGVWVLVSEVACHACGTWNVHNSCGAIIGAPDKSEVESFVRDVQAEAVRLFPDV